MKRIHLLFAFSFLLLSITACDFTQKIRDGETAYERMQFAVATKMLQKEYKKSKSRVERGKLAYMLADSYRRMNMSEQSIDWFRIAFDNQYGIEALKEHAYGLKKAERYEEAKLAFKELGIEIGSPYEYRREIIACENAIRWKKRGGEEYQLELMDFNSGSSDYSPVIYKDKQLVFTSDRLSSTGDDTYNWTGNAFSDLFLVDLQTNNVSQFSSVLNTPDNEGTVAFNKNYTEVYFTRCFAPKKEDAYCKLMVSQINGNSWGPPRVLNFVEDGVNYVQPALSEDGNSLYFASDHRDGWGGFDIYVSKRTNDGWSDPKLLSRSINTIGNEKFPYLDKDTLYFSSDFHPGMGGLDVFKSYQTNKGSWTRAVNLKQPINSGGDDFGYIIDHNAPLEGEVLQVGYFTSTRTDGIGGDDIFRFAKVPPPPKPEPEVVPEEIVYKMILDGYVLEKIYEDPTDPNSKVLGRKPLAESTVEIKIGKEKRNITVGEDGLFSIELDENTDYNFLASKENYLKNVDEFSTKGIARDPDNPEMRFEIEIVLDKIFLDKEIRLENIYYDFDRWEIRDDAMPTLDELVDNLKLNDQIRIQLGSHTDCRGPDRYNEDLSQKRAQSAVDYLISKGIDPTRLVAKGYGENEQEVNCICARCTEEEHQQNRRTTFKIIE